MDFSAKSNLFVIRGFSTLADMLIPELFKFVDLTGLPKYALLSLRAAEFETPARLVLDDDFASTDPSNLFAPI